MFTAKQKIDIAVQEYIKLFPQEFEAFKRGREFTIKNQTDKWASANLKESAIERHLFDLPERLHSAIHNNLDDNEREWFTATGDCKGNFEGIQWFMMKYPIFSITKEF